jgi:hypothetical protein
MLRNIILLVVAVTLSGCQTGVNLHYQPIEGANVSNRIPVSLSVTDQRKYVLSGDQDPSFLGKSRGGFGDTKHAYTEDRAPLADHLKKDLSQELRSLGFDEQASKDSRAITVTIQDWNSDGWYDVNFWYEVAISVTSPEGNVLAQSVIKDEKRLEGHGGLAGSLTIINEMPKVYGEIIKALVRDNKEVYSAMKTGMVSKKAE